MQYSFKEVCKSTFVCVQGMQLGLYRLSLSRYIISMVHFQGTPTAHLSNKLSTPHRGSIAFYIPHLFHMDGETGSRRDLSFWGLTVKELPRVFD